jgi:general secretion pathway protein G
MQATLERLRARREELSDEGGFTLIELLIVIVILAILAAIIVFAVQNLTGSSAKASCQSDLASVDHAVQAYYAQVGSAPTTNTALTNTHAGLDGNTVGPWLHSYPSSGHYTITVGATGGITVTPTAAPATPVPYTTAVDTTPLVTVSAACTGVS